MGLLNKLFGKKRIEEEVIKALGAADESEKVEYGKRQEESEVERVREKKEEEEEKEKEEEEEEEEEEEKEEEVSEDELISSLKKETEEEEEIDFAIREDMEKTGNLSAEEILELGRTVLQEMQGREGK